MLPSGWSLKRTVAPTALPLSQYEVKSHIRVDSDDEDPLIDLYLSAAVSWVEEATRRALMPQTWRLKLDEWPSGRAVTLPRPPLATVTSVAYKDGDGASQTWDSADYIVSTDQEPGLVSLVNSAEWPGLFGQPDDVTITYTAGYATAALVPGPIRIAILLIVKEMFDVRGETIEGSRAANVMAARQLLSPYVVPWL